MTCKLILGKLIEKLPRVENLENNLMNFTQEIDIINKINTIYDKINLTPINNNSYSKNIFSNSTVNLDFSTNYEDDYYIYKLVRDILKLRELNKKLFDTILASKAKQNLKIEILFKEFSFLSNLTKIRIVNFDDIITNKDNKVRGYFIKYNQEKSTYSNSKSNLKNFSKILYIEFDLNDEQLINANIFWKNMSTLYDL
jgi:hypothetical protein